MSDQTGNHEDPAVTVEEIGTIPTPLPDPAEVFDEVAAFPLPPPDPVEDELANDFD